MDQDFFSCKQCEDLNYDIFQLYWHNILFLNLLKLISFKLGRCTPILY